MDTNLFQIVLAWEQELNIPDLNCKTDFLPAFWELRKLPLDTKLYSFAYRFHMRAIVTNRHFYQMKISDTQLCSFCSAKKETYSHLFWSCEHVRDVWSIVDNRFTELH
jgi:hypothetical protein